MKATSLLSIPRRTPWKRTREGKPWWREIPNAAAVEHVYLSDYTRGVRATYFAIAFEMPANSHTTRAMFLRRLMAWSRCTDRQTRTHLDRLELDGEIRRHKRSETSKRARYEMVAMQGRLYAVPAQNAEATSGSGGRNAEATSGSGGQNAEATSGSGVQQFPHSATRMRKPLPHSVPGSLCTDLDLLKEDLLIKQQYAAWFAKAFPNYEHHNPLARSSVDLQTDAEVVADLLERCGGLEQLKALTVAMWQQRPSRNRHATWVAESDTDVRVIRRKLGFLTDELTRLGLVDADGTVHAPPPAALAAAWEQIRDRMLTSGVSRYHFHQCVAECRLLSDVDGLVTIWAPNETVRDLIAATRLEEPLQQAVIDVIGADRRVQFYWSRGVAERAG